MQNYQRVPISTKTSCVHRYALTVIETYNVVGQISGQFVHNRAFCEESTILTGCVDFYTSTNIRYRGICEINSESQKIITSDILI